MSIVRLFLYWGVGKEVVILDGYIVLYLVVCNGYLVIVKLFVEEKVDVLVWGFLN